MVSAVPRRLQLTRISHNDRGERGEKPGGLGARQHFVHVAQRTVCRRAGAMNRAPTSLMAGICFHSCRPLVRKYGLSGTDKARLLLRLAKYGDFGTRAQHAVPLQFEREPCQHHLRDSVTLRRAGVKSPAPRPRAYGPETVRSTSRIQGHTPAAETPVTPATRPKRRTL